MATILQLPTLTNWLPKQPMHHRTPAARGVEGSEVMPFCHHHPFAIVDVECWDPLGAASSCCSRLKVTHQSDVRPRGEP